MTGLVFLHGWGFGPQIWSDWRKAFSLQPFVCLDAGYFGPERLALPYNPHGWIGVGHSLGFARLLGMGVPWRALVGFGSFLRFCSKSGQETGTDPGLLDAMHDRLTVDPADVLNRFVRRCGLKGHSPKPSLAEGLARLRRDLVFLRDLDLAPAADTPPILLLHANDDRIAPVALAQEAQQRLPGARLELFDTGGHTLPFSRMQDCLPLVRPFVQEHLHEG